MKAEKKFLLLLKNLIKSQLNKNFAEKKSLKCRIKTSKRVLVLQQIF